MNWRPGEGNKWGRGAARVVGEWFSKEDELHKELMDMVTREVVEVVRPEEHNLGGKDCGGRVTCVVRGGARIRGLDWMGRYWGD